MKDFKLNDQNEIFDYNTTTGIFKTWTKDELTDIHDVAILKGKTRSKNAWYVPKLELLDKQAVMHEADIDDEDNDENNNNKINKWYGYEATIIIPQKMKPIDVTSLRDICKTEEEIVDYVQDNIGQKIVFDIVFNKNHITLRPFYKYYKKICEKYKRSKSYKSLKTDITYHYNNCIPEKDKITNKQLKLNNGKFYIYEE